jgi:hypothetical protein
VLSLNPLTDCKTAGTARSAQQVPAAGRLGPLLLVSQSSIASVAGTGTHPLLWWVHRIW